MYRKNSERSTFNPESGGWVWVVLVILVLLGFFVISDMSYKEDQCVEKRVGGMIYPNVCGDRDETD